MMGDMVIVKSGLIEQFRKKNALSKRDLAAKFSIHWVTSSRALTGRPVNLSIAKKIARIMGIPAPNLIEKWIDGDGDMNKGTSNGEKQESHIQ